MSFLDWKVVEEAVSVAGYFSKTATGGSNSLTLLILTSSVWNIASSYHYLWAKILGIRLSTALSSWYRQVTYRQKNNTASTFFKRRQIFK
ncbi:hypothetical protein [Vibrio vulnificus]|uniref:hypothetical protein n=1 Tax=Vibrio vulnificus TaxID=672 RepID=UPI002155F29C|nr:hypothetical protein [Vibrio vulnificus]